MNPIQGLRAALRTGSQLVAGLLLLLLTSGSEHAQAQQPGFLTDGLVAYYPFNGNANDESGNGRHGVKRGSNVDQMVPSVDRFGTEGASLRFPGNGYVDVRNLGITQPGKSPRSFFFWARLEHPQQSQVFAFSTGTGGPTGGRSMDWRFAPLPPNGASVGAEMMNWGRDTGVASAPVTNLITGAWEHWGAVYDGTQLLFFRNGLPVATQNGTNLGYDTSGDQALIGEQNDYRNPVTGSASCFKGLMDDMRFYSRALSTAEVKALYDYEATPRDNSFITNGLVAYYPFNGNANDATAGQNHAQVGSATLTQDRFGRANSAMRCNPAAGKWASLTTTKQISGPQVFTVSAWVRGAVGNLVYFSNASDGNPNIQKDRAIYIEGPSGSILKFYVYPGAEQWLISSKLMSTNGWSFVTVSLSEAGQKLFLNGDLVGANASVVSAEVFNGYWHFGNFSAAGEIDDIRIYNRALSDSEVKTLYAYESTPPDNSFITNGLVAYYPFNGNANDESGNGKHGVYSGAYGEDRNRKFGSALRLDGNAFVDAPNPVQNQITEPTVEPREITYSAWFNYQSGPPRMFLGSWGGAGGNGPNIRYDTYWGTNNICVNMPQSWVCAPFMNRSGEPDFNRWVHIGLTWKAGQYLKLYLDGKLVGSSKDGGTGVSRWNGDGNPPDRISIGGWTGHGGISGSVDDVRIYNRALSDAEIAALYAYESTTPVPTVVTAPVNQTVGVGQALSLSAEISGAGLAYRWQRDGVDLVDGGRVSGATTASLTITGVTFVQRQLFFPTDDN
jgi:hypothetical protein